MKTKKASILTKLVVLALLIGVASALLNLRGQIQQAQSDLTQAQAEVAAQKQVNADWFQIYQIVRENCSVEYGGRDPQDDIMERLLRARKG